MCYEPKRFVKKSADSDERARRETEQAIERAREPHRPKTPASEERPAQATEPVEQ